MFPIQSIKSLPGKIQDQSRVHGRFVIDFGDVEDDPEINVRGTLRIQDGISSTVLVAESNGSTASCSADPGTGEQGLTELNLLLREPSSGEQLMLLIAPIDGPAPIPGAFEAVFRIGDGEWNEEIAITRAGPPTAVRGGR